MNVQIKRVRSKVGRLLHALGNRFAPDEAVSASGQAEFEGVGGELFRAMAQLGGLTLDEVLDGHKLAFNALIAKLYAYVYGAQEDYSAAINIKIIQKFEQDGRWIEFFRVLLNKEFSSTDVDYLVNLGIYLKDVQNFDGERTVCFFLIKRAETFYWPYFRLGVLALESQSYREAQSYLTKTTVLQPDFVWGWFQLSKAEEAVFGADNKFEALQKALEAAGEDNLTVYIDAFSVLCRLTWSALTTNVFFVVLRAREFSDSDLETVTTAFAKALKERAKLIPLELLTPALDSDYSASIQSDGPSANWWPIHILAAIHAVEYQISGAIRLIRQASAALRTAASRNQRFRIFESIIIENASRLMQRLTLLDRGLWTDDISEQVIELCDLFIKEFNSDFLVEQGINLVSTKGNLYKYSARCAHYTYLVLKRRGSTSDIASYFNRYKNVSELTDSSLVKDYIRSHLTVAADISGSTLVSLVESFTTFIESAEILTQSDRHQIIGDLFANADIAFNAVYNEGRHRAVGGQARLEAEEWKLQLSELRGVIGRLEKLKHLNEVMDMRPGLAKNKVVVLTSPYIPQVRYYRAEQYIEMFDQIGINCEVYDLNAIRIDKVKLLCLDAGAVIFQRQPSTVLVVSLITWAREMGIKVIFDIDDLIFDTKYFPPPLADYEGNIDRETLDHLIFDCALFSEVMNEADAIVVSTEPLKEHALKVLVEDRPVYVRRNFVGTVVDMARARQLKRKVRPSETISIFYGSGTKAHKGYFFEAVAPALVTVLKRFPNVRLLLIGHFLDLDILADVKSQIKEVEPNLNFAAFLDILSQVDINIAPLDQSPATNCKSELKWFEAAALGVPSIVSRTQNYVDVLQGGVHALIAQTPAEWEKSLEELVNSPATRAQLVENSKVLIDGKYRAQYWVQDFVANVWKPEFAPEAQRHRKKLLVVNTYFWPQSVGGATRVAETYVDELVRSYGEEFEVFVLTANAEPGNGADYETEIYWYGGALVTQINVPLRDWADTHDPKVENIVLDLIDKFQFDAAHLHSIQILTASVLTALNSRRVPVLLTLHDAWWLSEHQFLVDEQSNVIRPAADYSEIYETFTARFNFEQRLKRRRDLANLLRSCAKVVAVSESFAKVYHAAGFPFVEVLENGMVPETMAVSRSRPKGRVRIGFIGGKSDHKGYGLLQRALAKTSLPNIELVEVDHSYPYGYVGESKIGDSKVTILGKFPRDRVAELYSKFDVLAAPSIWPESYGLVAREARFAGLPVIASDQGDIGRGIETGVDGWIIEVANENALIKLLKALDRKPQMADLVPRSPQIVSVAEAVSNLVIYLRDIL